MVRAYRLEVALARLILERIPGPSSQRLQMQMQVEAGEAGLRDVLRFLGVGQPEHQ
jgi:hypothetical protein